MDEDDREYLKDARNLVAALMHEITDVLSNSDLNKKLAQKDYKKFLGTLKSLNKVVKDL